MSQYIRKFIPIACPWGGSVVTLQYFVSGLSPLYLTDTTRTFPSNLYLFPVDDLMGDNKNQNQIMEFAGKSYGIKDIKDILKKAGFVQASQALD